MNNFYQKKYPSHPLSIFSSMLLFVPQKTGNELSHQRKLAVKGAIFTVFVQAAVTFIVTVCFYAVNHFYALYWSQYFIDFTCVWSRV